MKKYWEDLNKKVEWGLDLEIDGRAYSSWVVILVMSAVLGLGLGLTGGAWKVPIRVAEA